jgi:hypothetical protein
MRLYDRLFAQSKPYRPPGLRLSYRCTIRRVPARSDILDPDCDNVTTTKLAVDRQIEHGKVASAAFDLEFRPDRPDVFWSQQWLAPVNLPLFQSMRLWGVEAAFISSCMVTLLGYRGRGG